MAEPDAGGPAPAGGRRSFTLADIQRDLDRAAAPLREAQRQAERSMAPILAIARQFERDQRQIAEMLDHGIGRYLREIVGAPAQRTAPQPLAPDAADLLPAASPPRVLPTASSVSPARPRMDLDTSPEAMSALVERVAEAVVRRLATPPIPEPGNKAPPVKGRRGRRYREITVGGVDAALEALAEDDPRVRALSARSLNERGVPYSHRCIQDCATYKSWRRDLKAVRLEAAAAGMADVLDAGLARVQKKKPGRGRLMDPTIDPAVEKMTKEFLRLHGEEGLDGQ